MGLSVVVVGGGTMGLAAAWDLSRAGHRVQVLEQYEHVHGLGSHGGYTRIIREAYHEGTGYVPLVQGARRHWEALQGRVGQELLRPVGLLEFGRPDDPEFMAAVAACESGGVEYRVFDAAQARRRWPFRVQDDHVACLTPSGGYLRVPACLDALREEAKAHGATFRYGAHVQAVEGGARPAAVLANGERVVGERVVVAAGPYTSSLVPEFLAENLRALRRVLVWVEPPAGAVAELAQMPVWGAFLPEGFFYGFPHNDEGVRGLKLACHTSTQICDLDEPVDPNRVDRQLQPKDIAPVEAFLHRFLPSAGAKIVAHRVCLYGATSSWDFVIDRDPSRENVVVAAGFSGHGFKFAPVIGEIVTDRVTGASSRWPDAGLRLPG